MFRTVSTSFVFCFLFFKPLQLSSIVIIFLRVEGGELKSKNSIIPIFVFLMLLVKLNDVELSKGHGRVTYPRDHKDISVAFCCLRNTRRLIPPTFHTCARVIRIFSLRYPDFGHKPCRGDWRQFGALSRPVSSSSVAARCLISARRFSISRPSFADKPGGDAVAQKTCATFRKIWRLLFI